jgi:peptidoglycan/xylan/chitin deacetylase (PgdA/CDA1 family)
VRAAAPLAAAAWALPALAPITPLAAALRIPTRTRDRATVAITFDDGPHPQGTPAILEILREARAPATFFVIGEQVRRTGSLLDEIAAAGHQIAVHGDRHRNLLRVARPGEDLDRAAATIGRPVALHRAPYGIYSWTALRAVRRRGWTPALWSAWGRDWARGATGASVAAKVESDLDSGGVVLLHDADDYSVPGSWRATVAALPRILDAIGARGLRPGRLEPHSGR